MDNLKRGIDVYREFFGDEAAEARAAGLAANGFGTPITEMAMTNAFGGVWSRDGLERKQRSLVTMGILIATRQAEELKKHVQIGLKNGLTPREIEEVLVHCVPYVGLPTVAPAIEAVKHKLAELGISLERAALDSSIPPA